MTDASSRAPDAASSRDDARVAAPTGAPTGAPTMDQSPNDELAVPLEGRTEREWTPVLEAWAAEVFGPAAAAAWWGTPSPATWDVPPRALLSSLPGARRVRQQLLARYRSDHGVYA